MSKTKAEKLHLSRVAALGCIVCHNLDYLDSPAEIHHPRRFGSAGKKASHLDAIPLCPPHHRTGGYGVAIHAGQKTWEERFGTELELLDQVRRLLGD